MAEASSERCHVGGVAGEDPPLGGIGQDPKKRRFEGLGRKGEAIRSWRIACPLYLYVVLARLSFSR